MEKSMKLFSSLFGTKRKDTPKRATSRFRPQVEDLEGRALMSVVGPEIHVNTDTFLNQYQVDVASQPVVNGRSIAVWTHQYNQSGDTDIRAQLYDGFGNRIGGEFNIAANIFPEREASVAMDAAGNFVVVWVEDFNGAGTTHIFAQRFFANGVANGGRINVAID